MIPPPNAIMQSCLVKLFFNNLLPPLHLLPKDQENELKTLLKNLDFDIELPRAA